MCRNKAFNICTICLLHLLQIRIAWSTCMDNVTIYWTNALTLQPEEDDDKNTTLDLVFGGSLMYTYLDYFKTFATTTDPDQADVLFMSTDLTIAAMVMALEDTCDVFNVLKHYRVR